MTSISLEIAVEPPALIRLGDVLDPPLVATMNIRGMVNGYEENFSQIWAFVTLVDRNGHVVTDSLTGNLAESAQSFTNGEDSSGYFLFDNLSIRHAGEYRLQVTLMRMDGSGSGAASVQQVESRLVVVKDGEVEEQSPGMATVSKSRYLG